LLESKRLDRAGSFLGDYAEKNPQSFWAGSVYSKLLLQIDQPEAAERIVARLIKAGENDPEVHVTRARIAERMGRRDEAVDILTTAEKKYPKEDDIRFQLGRIHEERGNFKVALEKYSQISPESPIYRKVRDQISELNSKITAQSGDQDRAVANSAKGDRAEKKNDENTRKDGN
jgi:predicted Zn-dependent protease